MGKLVKYLMVKENTIDLTKTIFNKQVINTMGKLIRLLE